MVFVLLVQLRQLMLLQVSMLEVHPYQPVIQSVILVRRVHFLVMRMFLEQLMEFL